MSAIRPVGSHSPASVQTPSASSRSTGASFDSRLQAARPAAAGAGDAPVVSGAEIMAAFREMMQQQGLVFGNSTRSMRANVSIDSY